MKMIADDFDTGNEKFDASFYRILVEDTVSQIQFPVFKINIIDEMNTITNRFNGETTGANEKTQLEDALLKAITRILDELSGKLETEVRKFKDELVAMEKSVEKSLLQNITKEFEELLAQCDNKDKEINGYKEYTAILKKEIAGIKA